jgi:hypothetical protein
MSGDFIQMDEAEEVREQEYITAVRLPESRIKGVAGATPFQLEWEDNRYAAAM